MAAGVLTPAAVQRTRYIDASNKIAICKADDDFAQDPKNVCAFFVHLKRQRCCEGFGPLVPSAYLALSLSA